MNKLHQPSKEQIRQWLHERKKSRAPLPDRQQICEELGWMHLSDETRQRPAEETTRAA
jgi:hypothetical protein